jgi:hypothetical protein
MFRRGFVGFRRPFLRRPRLIGAALIGGLGFAAGRASRPASTSPGAVPQASGAGSAELSARLRELADLHAAGALTDEEFAAAKAKLLAS